MKLLPAVSAWLTAIWENLGSPVSSLAQYKSGRFIMQSMMAHPLWSSGPQSFQARMKFPRLLKRPARFPAASRPLFREAGFLVTR